MVALTAQPCEPGHEGQEPSPAPLSRRAAIARGTLALTAAATLAACAAPRPRPAPVATPVRRRETELDWLADGVTRVVVAGAPLDVGLLRSFYARRDFEPVWMGRQAKADALAAAVLRAGEHGMEPEQIHASLLHRRASFPPIRRELLLTHAVLAYADALAKGAVPPERRREGEALAPDPIDVTAVLDDALDRPDPAAAIEALAPATPTYRALRQACSGTGAASLSAARSRLAACATSRSTSNASAGCQGRCRRTASGSMSRTSN